MRIHKQNDEMTLWHGDCIEVMNTLPDNSVDSIVTDPPYGLGFMGKVWDDLPPGLDFAREALRVLKPGGHLLAFGGSRTWHRLAVAVEDAGFEIRDSIAWLYGSGFPKSLNLTGDWDGWGTALKPAFEPIVVGRKPVVGTVAANVVALGTGALNIAATRVAFASESDKQSAKPQGAATARSGALAGKAQSWESATTSPTTPSITALTTTSPANPSTASVGSVPGTARTEFTPNLSDAGRWPTNVLLDESQAATLDEQSGTLHSGVMRAGSDRAPRPGGTIFGAEGRTFNPADTYGDSGGASRFFPTFRYEAKAPTSERPSVDGVQHPTVKPLELMRWLVRLVTPRGGLVLEPFAGSGTTIEAALLEGFRCIGIEREESYLPLIEKRINKPLEVGFDFGDWDGAA